ncbi:MAG: hypothetical protein WC395_04010 [Bacteroidales bacterium]|jgi:hypothetical protein
MKVPVYIGILCILAVFTSCSQPPGVSENKQFPPIYPDYTEVTVPVNIAPLNFMVRQAQRLQVTIASDTKTIHLKGRKRIRIPMGKWRKMLQTAALGQGSLRVDVAVKEKDLWTRYAPFNIYVTSETIDPYLSYRLIEPGYEVWKSLQLAERNVETFRERIIADNSLTDNSCMNCHTYGNQDPGLSFFHLRGPGGGTVLNRNGELRKININSPEMISPVVYGNIHPSGNYGVFSSNIVLPGFHTQKGERLEVYDTESDLVVVDFRDNTVIPFPEEFPREFRTFPVFSADGNAVFYCNAPYISVPDSIYHLRYDLLKISFDPASASWGSKADTVVKASSMNLSVCHPKTSPDGKYLLFTMADYGTFPIWHQETDMWLLHLETGEINTLKGVNSTYSDTYHSWSSNSGWFVFASKRDDGIYGKPYFCYVDQEGNTHKPFVLPQKDPRMYDNTLKSYNIPELSKGKLPFGATDIERLYKKSPAENVSMK